MKGHFALLRVNGKSYRGLAMAPLDWAMTSSEGQIIVTISLSAAVLSQI